MHVLTLSFSVCYHRKRHRVQSCCISRSVWRPPGDCLNTSAARWMSAFAHIPMSGKRKAKLSVKCYVVVQPCREQGGTPSTNGNIYCKLLLYNHSVITQIIFHDTCVRVVTTLVKSVFGIRCKKKKDLLQELFHILKMYKIYNQHCLDKYKTEYMIIRMQFEVQ